MALVREAIEWLEHRLADDGTAERSFRVARTTGAVPGVVWTPPAAEPARGLVLLGHGGSGHKRSERIAGLGAWFATHGLAAVAIDGPYHGDRVAAPLAAADYQARICAEGIEAVLDRMAGDWRATVGALGALGVADTGSLAYVGLSMGTRYGLPAVVALGDRVRCAVFGKFGMRQSAVLRQGLDAAERVGRDARRITAPLLFHLQWDDEIFPREGQLTLFGAFGSADKQLIAYPGEHAVTRPEAVATWREFVTARMPSPRARMPRRGAGSRHR